MAVGVASGPRDEHLGMAGEEGCPNSDVCLGMAFEWQEVLRMVAKAWQGGMRSSGWVPRYCVGGMRSR